ncbi:MAG: protein jag [Synergistaceae bacterium]|nr:protein jag [Synergistaceae bacterium]
MGRKTVEKTAKTVQDAIALALVELDLELDDVSYEVLDEGKSAIFGLLGGKMAKVRVTSLVDDEREEGFMPSADTVIGSDHMTESDIDERQIADISDKDDYIEENDAVIDWAVVEEERETILSFLKNLFNGIHVEIDMEFKETDEGYAVNITSDDSGILIGHRGETLEAIQYLTNLCINRGRDEYIRVTVDIEGYRKKREESLVRLAEKVSEKAVRIRRNVTLEPMNSYERRVIHSTLQSNTRVETYSVGEEPNRKVVVAPKNKGGSSYGNNPRYRR